MPRGFVRHSPELDRIRSLPVHTHGDQHWEEAARLLTEELRVPGGTWAVKPNQAEMIINAYDARGLFCQAPVGAGKTLPTFVIPELLGAERPVLFIKASLRTKTKEDYKLYGKHFRLHPNLRFVSYDMLSRPDAQELLYDLNPDAILCDEAQALKNFGATRTKRFLRFLRYAEPFDPNRRPVPRLRPIPCFFFSGSMSRKSLRDFWHFLSLALPEGSPLPYTESDLNDWCASIDAKIDGFQRLHPGPLLKLAEDFGVEDANVTTRARKGINARLNATLGVVSARGSSCDQPLSITERVLDVPPVIEGALHHLRTTWEAPNGDECDSTLEIWRHARELACGFYNIWDPPPPEEWLKARKAWHRFVRGIIERGDPHLDSPFHVANHFADHPLHEAWVRVRDTYEPSTVPVWVDDYMVDDAAGWLAVTGGICWVEHVTVGERIARAAGVRYYGAGPRAAADIEGGVSGPIVCSIRAHGEGRNLQQYTDNLIVSPPPSGTTWEQMLGRTHRYGQSRPVSATIYAPAPEIAEGFAKAVHDARYIQETMATDQKLLAAEINVEFDLDSLVEAL